jgi:hypothetical protein
MKDPTEEKAASYKPSAFYWRKEIRAAKDMEALRKLALCLVSELEIHKAEYRKHGIIPPKTHACVSELAVKPSLAPLAGTSKKTPRP